MTVEVLTAEEPKVVLVPAFPSRSNWENRVGVLVLLAAPSALCRTPETPPGTQQSVPSAVPCPSSYLLSRSLQRPQIWVHQLGNSPNTSELPLTSAADNPMAAGEAEVIRRMAVFSQHWFLQPFVCVCFLSRLEVVTVTTSSMNHVSVKKQSFNCLT